MSRNKSKVQKKKRIWTLKHVLAAWKRNDKRTLNTCCNHFDEWFNPKSFPYNRNTTGVLISWCGKRFDDWFDDKTFTWKTHSYLLIDKHYKKFDKWWNPKKFNWKDAADILVEKLPERFDDWYDPKLYPDSELSVLAAYLPERFDEWWPADYKPKPRNMWCLISSLIENCGDHFDKWFHIIKLNRTSYTWSALLGYCPEHFLKYWDPKRFNWKYCKDELIEHASKYFDVWWNRRRFNAGNIEELAIYCMPNFNIWFNQIKDISVNDWSEVLCQKCSTKFDDWWDPEEFDWHCYSWTLASHCWMHFEKWWNPNRFRWNKVEALVKCCSQYIEIWYVDYDTLTQKSIVDLVGDLGCDWRRSDYDRDDLIKDLEMWCSCFNDIWRADIMIYKLENEERRTVNE